jgi:hypothetical protein
MGQWLGSDAIKIATFHAEIIMGNTEDLKSVITQKDRV